MATDCPELVMRSGRWLAHRTMDVYLQELNATVYFPRLPSTVKERALELAHSLPALLSSLGSLLQSKVAPELWYAVLTKKDTDGKNGRNVPGRSAGGKALHREKQTWMMHSEKGSIPATCIYKNNHIYYLFSDNSVSSGQ